MTVPDVDAVVLVGGQGTRLRPLTLSTPKPMLPTAGVPFLEHLLSRVASAGITHVVLGTSYRAETFSEYFGDGTRLGLEIDYVFESEPLGTGGGIRNVDDHLRADTVMVFNGDVLSGVDLPSIVATHRANRADVTLHLVKVADPRAFGSVPTSADGRVEAFLEKTENPPTDHINAGCYVFRREIISSIPAGRVVSVERDTFPGLLRAGARVFGHLDSSYWLDLGTPAAFVQGSADLVSGEAPTAALPAAADRTWQRLIMPGATVAGDATIDGGSSIGTGATVGAGAVVRCSVVMDGARIEPGARVERTVVGRGAVIGAGTLAFDAVVGEGAVVGAGCELREGVRIWPGTDIGDGAVRLAAEQ